MQLKTDIIKLIKDENAKDVFCNFAEVALDSLSPNGPIKDIPILGSLVKTGNFLLTIKDRIFIKKVASFLRPLETISVESKDKFISKLDENDFKAKVGEQLIILIDKQDNLQKSELIGLVFKEYIKGNLDKDEFEMICHSISNAYLGDLGSLPYAKSNPDYLDEELGAALFSCNLTQINIHIESIEGGTFGSFNLKSSKTANHYKLNKIGLKLAEIIDNYKRKDKLFG